MVVRLARHCFSALGPHSVAHREQGVILLLNRLMELVLYLLGLKIALHVCLVLLVDNLVYILIGCRVLMLLLRNVCICLSRFDVLAGQLGLLLRGRATHVGGLSLVVLTEVVVLGVQVLLHVFLVLVLGVFGHDVLEIVLLVAIHCAFGS